MSSDGDIQHPPGLINPNSGTTLRRNNYNESKSEISEEPSMDNNINVIDEDDEQDYQQMNSGMGHGRGPGKRGARKKGLLKEDCKRSINDKK